MSEDLVVLELAQQWYALPVGQVREVLPRASLTALAGAPAGLLGILALRGSLLPVIDLRQRLGLPGMPPKISQCIVVADLEGSAVGFLVDAVAGIVANAQTGAPTPRNGRAEIVRQVAEIDGRVISILDPDTAVGAEIAAYVAAVAPRSDAALAGGGRASQAQGRPE